MTPQYPPSPASGPNAAHPRRDPEASDRHSPGPSSSPRDKPVPGERKALGFRVGAPSVDSPGSLLEEFVDIDRAARTLAVHKSIVERLIARGHLVRLVNAQGVVGVSAASLAKLLEEEGNPSAQNWLTRPILELAEFLSRLVRPRN